MTSTSEQPETLGVTVSEAIAQRLADLRRQFPDSIVQIDAVRADDTAIAIKATVGLPGGARHSAIAAVDVNADGSWADQFSQVQSLAVGNAIDGLGDRLGRAGAAPTRQKPAQASASTSTPQPSASTTAESDHLPEYSWNAFWQTMNQRGIARDQVEQALGKTVQEATPKEAVDALKSAGLLS